MEVISAWEVYLWTRLDDLCGFFGACSFFLGFLSVVIVVISFLKIMNGSDWSESGKRGLRSRLVKSAILGSIIFSFIAVLIPSKKDAAMIWVIPKIANNQHIQQEASEIYTMAKNALREALGQEVKKAAEK